MSDEHVEMCDPVVGPFRGRHRPILGSTPIAVLPGRPSSHGVGSRPPARSRLTVKQREVLKALQDAAGPVPAAGLEPHTGLSVHVIRRALGDLRELGLAQAELQRGGARGTVWTAS